MNAKAARSAVTRTAASAASATKRFLRDLVRAKGLGWSAARIAILVPLALATVIMGLEDRFIYFPTRYPDGPWDYRNTPVREGEVVPAIEDCWFKTSDGLTLHGWYCTPVRKQDASLEPLEARTVLLWFHGNAGNISYRYDMIRVLMKIPARVFIIDYRGYGRSEGSPSEDGLYLDARAAWDYLTQVRGVAADRIIIFGKSLGGVPAVDLSAQVHPAGLIVQSSFTSAKEMAAMVMPFIPSALLSSKMDSVEKIQSVDCPKLFIHSRADEVVPFELGYRLYEAAPEPKEFYEVANAPHNATYLVGGEAYVEAMRRFVRSCEGSGDGEG